MNLQEYSNWLVEFSKKYEIPEENKLPVYLAGIIEEVAEYESLYSIVWEEDEVIIPKRKKELGDVLAYLVLARSQISTTTFIITNPLIPIDLVGISLCLGGYLKRLYRGDILPLETLHEILNDIYFYILDKLDYNEWNMEEIIDINIEKLTNRKILKGNGDER